MDIWCVFRNLYKKYLSIASTAHTYHTGLPFSVPTITLSGVEKDMAPQVNNILAGKRYVEYTLVLFTR